MNLPTTDDKFRLIYDRLLAVGRTKFCCCIFNLTLQRYMKSVSYTCWYNNNNNKTFKSQTSWDRLELKPSRSNQGSGTWITVFQALLSKAKSLGIFHPFKSPFIASTQVNFGLPLPLFTLLSWLRIPLRTGASGGLRWTCPNHLNRCWTSFSSIGATPNLSRISSFRTRSLLVWPQIQRNYKKPHLKYWSTHAEYISITKMKGGERKEKDFF